MADTKISALPSATATTGDQIPIARSGANYRVSAESIASLAPSYTLPTASTSVLGGVKVDGVTITIAAGVISSTGGYSLPIASALTLGGVKVGSGLSIDGLGVLSVTGGGGGSGTVTSVSVATANGLAGTVANATTTPAITLSTSVTGLIKGDGTAFSAAVAGTDYVTPAQAFGRALVFGG